VVISIIGLLSSIVLASLNSARAKAKDAAIKAGMVQFATLATMNYDDYGSYCNLQPGWISYVGSCNSVFSGTYASNAQNICNSIYNNASVDSGLGAPGKMQIFTGTDSAHPCASNFSFMAILNSGKWFCVGSSGARGEYATYGGNPGCWDNP
jgi:type II secretory pathway pseudopilin PulG